MLAGEYQFSVGDLTDATTVTDLILYVDGGYAV